MIRYDIAVYRQIILLLIVSLLFLEQAKVFAAPVTSAGSKPEEMPLDSALDSPSKEGAEIPLEDNAEKAKLTIQVRVPQNGRVSNKFTVYPYPVEMPNPNPRLVIAQLATTSDSLRNSLRTLGYSTRTGKAMPYPTAGYRTNYAFKRALKAYGGGQPHTLAELYRWIDDIYPYFETEILKSNEQERLRGERLAQMKEECASTQGEIETEALKKGLYPVDVRISSWQGLGQLGEIELPKAKWWVVGTNKTLGLSFYWQEPIDLSKGNQHLNLNDANALIIQGAW